MLDLRDGDLGRLVDLAAATSAVGVRAQIVLLTARGLSVAEVAAAAEVSRPTVRLWRDRYVEHGLAALRGRARPITRLLDDRAILTATLEQPPRATGATHWSARSLGAHLGVGHSTVARAWQAYGVRPRGAGTFHFATTPELVAHVTDVVGLAVGPDVRLVALVVHDAADARAGRHVRSDASLASGLAPISLYAALRAALDDPRAHGTRGRLDLARFLRLAGRAPTQLDRRHPDLALVTDDEATLRRPELREWLAGHGRTRLHLAAGTEQWLNLVEACLTIVELPATRRGAVGCVPELDELVRQVATGASPLACEFVWTERVRAPGPSARRRR